MRSIDHLLIGGGIAGAACARELRAQGADGSIALVGRELDPPYHRPPCTKGYLRGEVAREATAVLPSGWWADNDVELLTRTSVVALDLDRRVATLSTKEEVAFGTALLATGAMVRRLGVDGSELEGIHYVRALGNADAVRRDLAPGMRVLLVGGSYIACEVAASLAQLGHECTVLMQEALPMERSFGATAGGWVRELLTGHGVTFVAQDALERFEGSGGRLTHAVTAAGRRLPADLAVVGVGAVADATLARRAQLEIGRSGGVAADAGLRTSHPDVYAAGDACEFGSVLHRRPVRIEHEEVARTQGEHAARGILGAAEAYAEAPYFWCDLADWATLEYVGLGGAADQEELDGDPSSGRFAIRFLREGRLDGVMAVGRPDVLAGARDDLVEAARAAQPSAR
jgi:3-phenylpropionate/trans-cinnamate dioxygenase ferredoxin reductase subunit